MARNDGDLFDLITELPWWAGVALSALIYAGMRWGVALLPMEGMFSPIVVDLSAIFAPWVALLVLLASAISALKEIAARNRSRVEQKAKVSQGISTCPRCGSELVLRTARKGANAGGRFWGCSAYPRCRHTQEYVG